MKSLILTLGFSFFVPNMVAAEDSHSMVKECKKECPNAKTEDEAHKCMSAVAKKKKGNAEFMKSECFHAFQEHEEQEKKSGH